MSASSKKKLRKEQESVKLTEQQIAAQKEAKKLNLYTTIFVVVLTLILVTAIVVGVKQTVTNSGILEKKTVAMTVDGHEISNAELSYFFMEAVNNFSTQYGSYAAMFGLDTSKPLDEQVIDEETGLTWADDFLNSAKENAKSVYALADAAEADGFALSEEDVTAIEQGVANIEAYAKLYGYEDGESYLKAMYGRGATKESFLAFNKLTALANAYYADYAKSLAYEEADLRAVDSENYEDYSSFAYNTYYLSTNAFLTSEEPTDEEKAAAVAAAEAAAKELTSDKITSVEELDTAIAGLAINKDKTVSSTENKQTLGSSVNSVFADWVKDGTRKAGDIAYFASTASDDAETVNGYYVVMFNGSTENKFELPNVRHILVKPEGGTTDETTGQTTYSDEEMAAAKAEAEEILAQWESGDKTEESFASLANEKSDDGDGTTGGLYENIQPGQMVENFNDWCFETGRKAGDTDIVETQFGYHVMYFSGYGEQTYRDYMIENKLRSADAQAWYEETVEAVATADGDVSYVRTDLVLGGNQ